MNTCEWAIQDRLVHCHHIGEPHDHPPHPKPWPKYKGGYYFRQPCSGNKDLYELVQFWLLNWDSSPKHVGACMCVMHHAFYKQVKSFLFIWEGSESRKPSCRSWCCLCSLHLNLLSIFVQQRRGRTFNPRDKSNGPRRRFVEFKCRK